MNSKPKTLDDVFNRTDAFAHGNLDAKRLAEYESRKAEVIANNTDPEDAEAMLTGLIWDEGEDLWKESEPPIP